MSVVSNTSPIINLASIGRLDLLPALYGRIVVPQAVFAEITVDERAPGAVEFREANWVSVHEVSNRALVDSLFLELDSGEAEAIACAVETQADVLLIDERLGRRIAGRLGVRIMGLLGLVIQAKRTGLITHVRPLVDELIGKAGFWISTDLYAAVLAAAHESDAT